MVALLLGGAAVASAALLGRTVVEAMRIKHAEKRIIVTGSATRRIRADLVVWHAGVKAQGPELAQAYKRLAADMPALVAFIKAQGIDEGAIKVASVAVRELHPRDKDGNEIPEVTSAYVTEQIVEVSSTEIDKVEKTSRAVTELIDRGIYLQSQPPLYIYTKLPELKLQILAEASKDARQRAEQIAQNAGGKLEGLITARMGVMQVNPAHSSEVSAEGNNDKTSLEKDALGVVTAAFAVQ